jgi:hypothetical protein
MCTLSQHGYGVQSVGRQGCKMPHCHTR